MHALRYGWKGALDTPDSFWVSITARARPSQTWKDEVLAAARKIAQEARRPIWVCLSGGTSSEIIARAFFDQGINISVLTLAHKGGTNERDIAYARRWCERRGLHQTVTPLDVDSFLKDDIERYAETGYVADHPYRYLHLKLLEIVSDRGGYAVIGGDEQQYRTDARGNIEIAFSVRQVAGAEWCARNAVEHEPNFFFSTPEMFSAYQHIPLIRCAIENPEALRDASNSDVLKRVAYRSAWTDLEPRPVYDGFEFVRGVVDAKRSELKERFGTTLQTCMIPLRGAQLPHPPTT